MDSPEFPDGSEGNDSDCGVWEILSIWICSCRELESNQCQNNNSESW